MLIENYLLIEFTFDYKHADWQHFVYIIKRLINPLSLRTFEGKATPAITNEYTREHWSTEGAQMGYGDMIISNANTASFYFSFRLYDDEDENRFIEFEVNCAGKKGKLTLSLDNRVKGIKASEAILSSFEIARRGEKASTVSIKNELEAVYKLLRHRDQEQGDFDLLKSEAEFNGFKIGLLFIDIDHFKDLNTRYTETKVDEYILPRAQRLLRFLIMAKGYAYRHGGDEFLVILPNHDKEETLALAKKMCKTFESHFFEIDESEEKVTLSIGCAVFPDEGDKLANLIAKANTNENAVKKGGRNKANIS
jgi:diguanylate cyclase (GGDEF)-like protein